jgi:phage terminase large subunit GpA-like protein
LDEIDSYPDDVEQEGDPVELAEARTRTYARRKIFKNSTPTMEGRSRVANEYAQTDQRKYFVPCPALRSFPNFAMVQRAMAQKRATQGRVRV